MNDLAPRLIKGMAADYLPVKWDGENTSGIKCLGPHILVLVHEAAETRASGIHRTADEIEKANMACEMGVVVAIGAGAFRLYEDGRPFKDDERPHPGDRIYFEKYAGRLCMGADGLTYRLMDYRSVGCVYDKEIENIRRHIYVMDGTGRASCQQCDTLRQDVIEGTAPRLCPGQPPERVGNFHDFGSDGLCTKGCGTHRVDVSRGHAKAECDGPRDTIAPAPQVSEEVA